jgi:ATP synthase protein I
LNKEPGDLQQQCLTPPENAAIIPALLDIEAKEEKIAHKVILLQMVITLFAAGIAYSTKDTPQLAIAVLGGGAISVVNGALLAWRMVRAASHPANEALHQLRLVVLLCICMAVLKLSPLALLGGFVMGQAVHLAGRFILSSSRLR